MPQITEETGATQPTLALLHLYSLLEGAPRLYV